MNIAQSPVLTPNRSARDLYGSEVRRYRTNAGMSLAQLADVLRYSKSHLGNIETAERMIPPGISESLDAAFGTDGHFLRLYSLARKEQHPGKYRQFMELEDIATEISEYAGHMIPGILQIEPYARECMRVGDPEATGNDVDEMLAARMARQEILVRDPPPNYWVILDEAVLWRPVGGYAVMRDQLAALLPMVNGVHTQVHVIPYANGCHALLGGSMVMLTLPDQTKVVHLEGIQTGALIEDRKEVDRRRRALERLRGHALSPAESATMIASAMEDFSRCEQN